MNVQEHLVVCCTEECLEIADAALRLGKALCKTNRFGMEDHHPERTATNREEIIAEFNDLVGCFEKLSLKTGISLDGMFDRTAIEKKQKKLDVFMEISREIGTLFGD